jgi:hypothetical protein
MTWQIAASTQTIWQKPPPVSCAQSAPVNSAWRAPGRKEGAAAVAHKLGF